MDNDLNNMDDIESLMEDMFEAGMPVNVINDKLIKMGGSLEIFIKEEADREKETVDWLKTRSNTPPAHMIQSEFNGIKKHNIGDQRSVDSEIVFEKDDQNSSLAGVKTSGVSNENSFWKRKEGISDGIEDIHDFFAVGRGQKEVEYDLTEIDEQTKAMKNLSASDQLELDEKFVREMGMDLQRIRKISGATSAWQEIASIKRELKELSAQSNKLIHRFEDFIDLYVKDKIPK